MSESITPWSNLAVTPPTTSAALLALWPKLALYYHWGGASGELGGDHGAATGVSIDWIDRIRGLNRRNTSSYKDASGCWVNGNTAPTFPAGTMPDFNNKHVVAFAGVGAAGTDVTTTTLNLWDSVGGTGAYFKLPITAQAGEGLFVNEATASESYFTFTTALTITAATPIAVVGYANYTHTDGTGSLLCRASKGQVVSSSGAYTETGAAQFNTVKPVVTDWRPSSGLQAVQPKYKSLGVFLFDTAPSVEKLKMFAQLLSIYPDKLPVFLQGL